MSSDPSFEYDEPAPGQALSLIYSCVYCSRAAADVDADVVDRIIETSRRNNPARGITGLLVFGSGIFFQWLEGPRESVVGLMERIEKDPRHHGVVVLDSDEEVRERVFADWDMELVDPDDVRNVLVDALNDAKHPTSARTLRDMLEALDSGRLAGIGRGAGDTSAA